MRLPEAALEVRMMLSEKHPFTSWKSICASQGLGRIWVCALARGQESWIFSLQIVDSCDQQKTNLLFPHSRTRINIFRPEDSDFLGAYPR